MFFRWYGSKAESFVLARLRACGDDNDREGVTAWAELLKALRTIKADAAQPPDDTVAEAPYPEAPQPRRLFNFGGRAA